MADINKSTVQTENNDIAARIERNRQRAIALRSSHLSSTQEKRPKIVKSIVTGGGFLLEANDNDDWPELNFKEDHSTKGCRIVDPTDICSTPCDLCGNIFYESFLKKNYHENICNSCRDSKGAHKLIARSEAKETYLLKDADLDQREPKLPYIERRNPHRPGGTMMRLYLELQVIKRAEELWGSLEKIEEELDKRMGKREQVKQKRFDKKVTALRKTIRGNVGVDKFKAHEHEYGEETCDPETDVCSRTCRTCGFVTKYETM